MAFRGFLILHALELLDVARAALRRVVQTCFFIFYISLTVHGIGPHFFLPVTRSSDVFCIAWADIFDLLHTRSLRGLEIRWHITNFHDICIVLS